MGRGRTERIPHTHPSQQYARAHTRARMRTDMHACRHSSLQTPSLDQLSPEFSLYPNFGTKTIGRAVALPSMLAFDFTISVANFFFYLQVSFEIDIISPFDGVTLEIGGAVETYWKSLAVPHTVPAPIAKTATPRFSRARQLGSAQLAQPMCALAQPSASANATSSSLSSPTPTFTHVIGHNATLVPTRGANHLHQRSLYDQRRWTD